MRYVDTIDHWLSEPMYVTLITKTHERYKGWLTKCKNRYVVLMNNNSMSPLFTPTMIKYICIYSNSCLIVVNGKKLFIPETKKSELNYLEISANTRRFNLYNK